MEFLRVRHRPLQADDGIGQVDPLGARRDTVELRVTSPHAIGFAIQYFEALVHEIVARIEQPEQSLVDRRGAEVSAVAPPDAARGVTTAAGDAVPLLRRPG